MKHLLLLLTVLISFAGFAQTGTTDTTINRAHTENNATSKTTVKYWMDSTKTSMIQKQDSAIAMQASMKYNNMTELSYYIKNSKLHQCKNGQLRAIKMTIRLKNDATISTTGMLKMNDGKTMQLKNGDAIDRDGIITKFKK
ncbi:MAG TPA: hypothetical protein PK431_07120 [Chitinophagales bacterium]|nr:hypothetical protein [Chitinophagales bacterium]